MKQLLIVRHAKSDWGGPELEDFKRPLNQTGKTDAANMAERLLNRKVLPELLVSSTALRAISTARLFANTLQIDLKEIREESSIYEASAETLLKIVNGFDDEYRTIALFGHNPGVTELLLKLSSGDVYDLSPGSIALIEFPFQSWKFISSGTGELKFLSNPDGFSY